MKIKNVLIIVGLGNYVNASNRLYRQIKALHLSMDIVIIHELALYEIFNKEDISTKYLNDSHRGFGFWMWKPVIVNHYFKKKYNQIIYIDAGSEVIKKPFKNLVHWFTNSTHSMILSPAGHNMEQYTKMDTIVNFFDETEWKNFKSFRMFQAGVLFLKRNSDITNLFSTLTQLIKSNRVDLFDDVNSYTTNSPYFLDHRHDQSVFSLMLYKLGVKDNFVLFPSDLSPPFHNEKFNSFPPIMCLRNKSFLSYRQMYAMYDGHNKFPVFLKLMGKIINALLKKITMFHGLADYIFIKICFIWGYIFYRKLYLKHNKIYNNKEEYDKWLTILQFNKQELIEFNQL